MRWGSVYSIHDTLTYSDGLTLRLPYLSHLWIFWYVNQLNWSAIWPHDQTGMCCLFTYVIALQGPLGSALYKSKTAWSRMHWNFLTGNGNAREMVKSVSSHSQPRCFNVYRKAMILFMWTPVACSRDTIDGVKPIVLTYLLSSGARFRSSIHAEHLKFIYLSLHVVFWYQ